MPKKNREKSPYFLLAMDFGYTLLAAVGVFGYIGLWADNRFSSKPWLMLLGIGLGLAVGFHNLLRRLSIQEQVEKAAKKRPKQDGP